MGKAEEKKTFQFNQISPCTRGFVLATRTWQHSMQGDSSAWLTEHLDGGTFLMDVWQIQGLSWYFA